MTSNSVSNRSQVKTILTLFGTRPEIIKLAPVIWAMEQSCDTLRNINVSSSQHTDLLRPFIHELGIKIDHDLAVMTPGQTPNGVLSRVLAAIEPLLLAERPDLVLVQGDTTTAIAGALAAFYARIPVAHVEAGLRTGDRHSPFPEEMNRRLITQLADLHFAATQNNVETLLAEGVRKECIVFTGNPVVDALQHILANTAVSPEFTKFLNRISDKRLIVLTTHRRENFGQIMASHLKALRRFVDRHSDVRLVFPVHPNPSVRTAVDAEFTGAERIHCIDPLKYDDFLCLLSRAWLVISDSGGVQEEAPSLRKPLLVLRDTTERPEVLDCGVGRLVGHSGERLEEMLETALTDKSWFDTVNTTENPFGKGDAGKRIASAIVQFLNSGKNRS
ncbi:MAG: UDP-N-acetylglucosamine 2-epimerase (non-hydrolyzing) [Nitrosomonas sp.]|nr:MAG: UDP-N-acetylglucosamine 2-epimerase (non-hydrolyzing) [Nitrosomonas sp.]